MSYINSRSYELVVQKFVELYNSKYVHGMSQEYYGRTLPEPIEKVIKYLAANNFSTNEYIRDWAQDVEMPESLDNKIIYNIVQLIYNNDPYIPDNIIRYVNGLSNEKIQLNNGKKIPYKHLVLLLIYKNVYRNLIPFNKSILDIENDPKNNVSNILYNAHRKSNVNSNTFLESFQELYRNKSIYLFSYTP